MRRTRIDDDLVLNSGFFQLFIESLRNAHRNDLVGITEHPQDRVFDLLDPVKIRAVKISRESIKADGAGQVSVGGSSEKGERAAHAKTDCEGCTFAACAQAQIGQRRLSILEEVLCFELLRIQPGIEGIVAD